MTMKRGQRKVVTALMCQTREAFGGAQTRFRVMWVPKFMVCPPVSGVLWLHYWTRMM